MTQTPEAHGKYLPCLNANCKSHGKPHPNCRCYGLSDGGEVGSFCSESRAHKHDCEYFAGGGMADPDFIPDDEPDFIPDTQAEHSPDFIPDEQANDWTETAKAGAEGVSQGLLGPLAPMAEVGLGISTKEAIAKREEEHPVAHGVGETAGLVGGLLSGEGIVGAVGRGAEAASQAANIGKLGSAAIKAAVTASSFAGSDEVTKAFLGIPGSDPESPVSAALLHVGASGLMGSLTGGVFSLGEGLIGKGVASEAGAKAASKAQEFLFKLGTSDNPIAMLGVSAAGSALPAYKTSRYLEEKTDIPVWMSLPIIESFYTVLGNKLISRINPYVTSAAVRALSENEAEGVPYAIHYASQVAKGMKKGSEALDAIMTSGSSQVAPPTSDKMKEWLKDFISGGQVQEQIQNTASQQPQQFAHGGKVESEPNGSFSKVFPEQNTALNTAKGRISNYLNSLRPQANQPKKPYDKHFENKEQNRQYEKAIDFAVNPLGILNHVNKGDLTPEHMKHFTNLYPEVYRYLSGEMTKRITKSQLKDEMPSYGKRQAMSLFLGAELDSSFTPVAIQTIQGLYQNKKATQQEQAPAKSKSGKSTLSKVSQSYLTGSQARVERSQNQKS